MEYPPDLGGVARYLGALAEGQADFAVASPRGPISLRAGRWLSTLWRLPRLMTREGADILIISHILPMGYAALVCRFFGKPYVAIVHGLDLVGPLGRPGKKFLAGLVLRGAARVVANSQATAALVARFGVAAAKIRVVLPPLSWSPEMIPDEAETDLGSRLSLAGKRAILVAGRLVPRKGVDAAITALKSLPDAILMIAGEGSERGKLEALAAALGVAGQTIFLGRLAEPEMRDAYRLAEVVMYPSLDLPGDFEGFGIGAADAGLFGKPVVASRIGGLPEAVLENETGLLVPPGDAAALVQAARRLLDDQALADRLGARARQVALRRTPEIFRQNFRKAVE